MIRLSAQSKHTRRTNVERVTALLKGVMASVQKMLGGKSQGQSQSQKKK